MKIKALDLLQRTKDLGYFDDDYKMWLDPTFTYQEFIIHFFLRSWNWKNEMFDPDELLEGYKKYGDEKGIMNEYNECYEGAKHNDCVIDKKWEDVLQNKKGLKNFK